MDRITSTTSSRLISQDQDNGELGSLTSSVSAVFAHTKDLVINGGNFTNINHPPPRDPPKDFRTIPLGDLILNHEICSSNPTNFPVARLRKPRSYVRRMYSGEIVGLQSPITVAVISGPSAEEQWKDQVARYSNLRHPNLLHLYGITSSGGIHALIFHDDLVPWRDFRQQYDASHFSLIFFFMSMKTQIHVASQHVLHISGQELGRTDYCVWIRPSKGILHLELTPSESQATVFDTSEHQHTPYPLTSSSFSFRNPPQTSELMRSISVESYQDICYWDLPHYHWFTAPTGMEIQLGSVCYVPNPGERGWRLDEAFRVAVIPAVEAAASHWCTEDTHVDDYWHHIQFDEGTLILPQSGWIRVDSACVVDAYCLQRSISPTMLKAWMAQASHVFASLNITTNRQEYVFLDCSRLLLRFSESGVALDDLPPGYLFLYPPDQFARDHRYHAAAPVCPAYWSVDPSGAEKLTSEQASSMGFPEFQVDVKIFGLFWMDDVYAGMREFHAAKGYDPDTLDVATELRYPLYELACEKDDLHSYLRNFGMDNSSIGGVDSVTDQTDSFAEKEDHLVEDDSTTQSVYQSNPLGENQPSPRGTTLLYVQLALIGTCFLLTLCGL